MRHLIFIVALALLTGCKTHKNIVSDKSLEVDSIARSEHHRTIVTMDSLMRNIDFSFDTLKINIERPVEYAETTEFISMTVTNGRVIGKSSIMRNQVEDYNQLDSVAYEISAADASTELSATTRLFNPPDGYVISVVLLLVVAFSALYFFRKSK